MTPEPSAVPALLPTVPPTRAVRRLAARTDIVVIGVTDSGPVRAPGIKLPAGLAAHAAASGAREPLATAVLPQPTGPTLVVVVVPPVASSPGGGDGGSAPWFGGNVTPADPASTLRRAAAAGVRKAVAAFDGTPSIAVALAPADAAQAQAVTEGALAGALTRLLPVNADSRDAAAARLDIVTDQADAVTHGTIIAYAVAAARAWTDEPPNLLYPESFAAAITAYTEGVASVTTEVLDVPDLAEQGLGGILGVGQGSARGPRLVCIRYAPEGATRHVAFVGKGITFDSGGLDIKTQAGMLHMKDDMAGAAAVVAATTAIAELGLPVRVTGWVPLAENMPSGSAYRPSDVLTLRGGTTVENGNTDAEGRLVLADGLALAAEDEPDLIVDIATLTGAVLSALGEQTSGLFTDDDTVAARLLTAAAVAGERVWRLPLLEEQQEALKSKIADVRSTGPKGTGGASFAAAFLRKFVPSDIAWAHLDVAGTAYNLGEPSGDIPAGGTGAGVRTLIELARALDE
ncbi:leucyl aminopeptidase [Actinoplanes sp. RD1]|uniref:leucyl aminopeptidase n=1 Tax=Actinoplanes sp. RD1 TaxID=3064538 RepID=UPI002740891F|nr:leucyl aminopeptidase [Actinoplanes sp. RD1]